MKKSLIASIIFSCIWMLSSCSSDLSEESKYGNIAGSVSDATTGEPVPTVNVKLNPGGKSTVTGTDGLFSFKNLEPGEYTLEISKEHYKDNSSSLYVGIGDATPAHLLIERIPSIVTADRETLDFGENQSLNTLSFNIVNSSYEDLVWEIEERCDWITELKPAKGTLSHGKTEGIVVVIDRNKLKAGDNKAVLVIRSSQGSSQMNVTAVGEERTLPSLNVLDIYNVTASKAVFEAEITNSGKPAYTERGFVYSLTSNPTLENTIAKLTSEVTSKNIFSYQVTKLTGDKTYYVKAYAKNSVGVAYSANEITFKTSVTMPKVETSDVDKSDIPAGTATFRGKIITVGEPAYSERGFVYSTSPEPTINNNKIIVNGSGEAGSFSKEATNLPKTDYYVRAYATSSAGTVYGEQINVQLIMPEVETSDIDKSDVLAGTATFKGQITIAGNPPYRERGFVYSTSQEPTIDDNKIIVNGDGKAGSFSKDVTNLPKATYYVRAYATSSAGTVYGKQKVVLLPWVEIPEAGIAVQREDLGWTDWDSAEQMCKNSTLGGYKDWRLPTKDELLVLYNNRKAIGGFKNDSRYGLYWSATPTIGYDNVYVYVDFYDGSFSRCHVSYKFSFRAVRTLKKEE